MDEKFANLLRAFCAHLPAYRYETAKFIRNDLGRSICPISLFLFNLVIDWLFDDALGGLQDIYIELANLFDLDYADDFVCSLELAEHAQQGLKKLTRAIAPFGLCVALSTCSTVIGLADSSIDLQLPGVLRNGGY